jgi:hypothetical protein
VFIILVWLARYLSISSIKQSRFISQQMLLYAFTTKKQIIGLFRRGMSVYLMDFGIVGVSTCLTQFCLRKKVHVTFTTACNEGDNFQQTTAD